MKQAFLFDLNGTMIDDMHYHVVAWHRILNNLGASIGVEEVKKQCYGKNDELLERIFPGRFSEAEKRDMGMAKEKAYQEAFRPHLKLMEGLPAFLEKARQADIKMAIGSAAILFNIDFVLDGLGIRHYFDVIVSADDVVVSKPDPETFVKCAAQLGVRNEECMVFEDAMKGVEAALGGGMEAVVVRSFHEEEEFSYLPNVCLFIDDFRDDALEALFKK
ncbi:MAG: HAD family hydrolase [Sediminibacterium sp.]